MFKIVSLFISQVKKITYPPPKVEQLAPEKWWVGRLLAYIFILGFGITNFRGELPVKLRQGIQMDHHTLQSTRKKPVQEAVEVPRASPSKCEKMNGWKVEMAWDLLAPWKINGWNPQTWRFGSDDVPFQVGEV